ncbi:MAG: hypothetical protein OHK0039_43520 [Bacteroidia bacterium]
MLWPGCYNPDKGALSPDSRTELDLYAERFIDVEKKYLKVIEKLAQITEEAAAITQDQLAMEHIRKFASDNQRALDRIGTEFDGWQRYTDERSLILFIQLLNDQPSARKLRVLAPQFRERIRYNAAYLAEYDALLGRFDLRH